MSQSSEGPSVLAMPGVNGATALHGDGGKGQPPDTPPDEFRNFREEEVGGGEKKRTVRVGLPIQRLFDDMNRLTGGWPKRVGKMLFAGGPGHRPIWLGNPAELFSWVAGHLPATERGNRLRWAAGTDMVSPAQLFAFLTQYAEDYDAVEPFPHWPPVSRHYYLHQSPEGGDGSALRGLLQRFSPASDVDHDLMLAFFLTLLWGGPPGQRPAWLFTSDDEDDPMKGRGAGKSTLPKIGGQLVGGYVLASANEEMERVKTRLLSPDAREKRVVLIDNIKTLKFSCAELEAEITSDTVSGRQLYLGEGRRPNTLTWCLTINGASLSKDMAQRVVTVKVRRPVHTDSWEDETREYVEANRWRIIGDCLAILREPGARLEKFSRWGAWEKGVLSRVGDPSECQQVILERQDGIDDDAGEADVVREAFRAELRRCGYDPDAAAVRVTCAEAAAIVNAATQDRMPVNKACSHLATLAVPEVRRTKRGSARGWAWRGKDSPPGASLSPLGLAEQWSRPG